MRNCNNLYPLGYSNVSEIIEIGKNVEGFKVGDRVISNAPHAEIVLVPKNLCCLIPENVDDDSAGIYGFSIHWVARN